MQVADPISAQLLVGNAAQVAAWPSSHLVDLGVPGQANQTEEAAGRAGAGNGMDIDATASFTHSQSQVNHFIQVDKSEVGYLMPAGRGDLAAHPDHLTSVAPVSMEHEVASAAWHTESSMQVGAHGYYNGVVTSSADAMAGPQLFVLGPPTALASGQGVQTVLGDVNGEGHVSNHTLGLTGRKRAATEMECGAGAALGEGPGSAPCMHGVAGSIAACSHTNAMNQGFGMGQLMMLQRSVGEGVAATASALIDGGSGNGSEPRPEQQAAGAPGQHSSSGVTALPGPVRATAGDPMDSTLPGSTGPGAAAPEPESASAGPYPPSISPNGPGSSSSSGAIAAAGDMPIHRPAPQQQPGTTAHETTSKLQHSSASAPSTGALTPFTPTPPPAAESLAQDALAAELAAIINRQGGVGELRHAGRLGALVAREERLGGRLTLLTVLQASSQEVLRAVVQGGGLKPLEAWVVSMRDGGRHSALVAAMRVLRELPVDLAALRGSSIGQTVGKLRKHSNPGVRSAAAELVDQWKGMVDRSVGKGGESAAQGPTQAASAAVGGAGKQGVKSKHEGGPALEAPSKRPKTAAGGAAAAKHACAAESPPAAAASTLQVMDDDLFMASAPSGVAGAVGGAKPAGGGLSSFVAAPKKVHAMKLEGLMPGRAGAGTSGAAVAVSVGQQAGDGMAGEGAAAASASGDGDNTSADGASSPRPSGDAAPLAAAGGTDGAQCPAPSGASAANGPVPTAGPPGLGGVPRPATLPRLGSLSGGPTLTARLGSLRDGSLPTAGIARLGAAAGGVGLGGGRAGPAASLPAAVAPGGPQSAHARAMAARARAPSPEPGPRREKRKSVSWAGNEALATYRLFRKDDPPQLAATDAAAGGEEESGDGAGGALGVGSTGPEGAIPSSHPPGFESAARREHASERMALIAQHQQEEAERQQELERLNAMVATLPWREPPELCLGGAAPQQLPGLGEESVEREVQAAARMRTPRATYPSPDRIPPCPAEAPYDPDYDPRRARHIPLDPPGLQPGAAAAAAGMPPPHVYSTGGAGGMPAGPGASGPAAPYGGQLLPGPGPLQGGPMGAGGVAGGGVGPAGGAQGLTLPPELVASLPALINSLSQQPQQGPQGPGLGQPGPGAGGQQAHPHPGGPPLMHMPGQHPHPHPHGPPHPHAPGLSSMPYGGPGGMPPPGFGMHGAGGGPGPGQGPGPNGSHMMGPGGHMPPHHTGAAMQMQMGAPGRPGGLRGGYEGHGPAGPPPPPPRKDGQPTLMRPRRADDHPMGPGSGSGAMPPPPPGVRHPVQGGPPPPGMGGPPGPVGGGWPPQGGPPPGGPPSSKVCAYFNTPAGCRNGDACRFLHVPSGGAQGLRGGGGTERDDWRGGGFGGPPSAGPRRR